MPQKKPDYDVTGRFQEVAKRARATYGEKPKPKPPAAEEPAADTYATRPGASITNARDINLPFLNRQAMEEAMRRKK